MLSGTVAILTIAVGHYRTICDDKSLPDVFHGAAYGLLRVSELLQLIETQLAQRNPRRSQDALAASEACNRRARLSEEMLKGVCQAPKASRFHYYRAAVRQRGREGIVEVLAIGMMGDVCSLAGDGALEGGNKKPG